MHAGSNDVCSTAHIRLKSSDNDSRVADLRFPLSKNPVDIWNVHESTLLSRNRTNNLRYASRGTMVCTRLSPVSVLSVDTNRSLTPRLRRRGN